ncbi:NAD(P)/FAD-dependent oxidoreductase [Streptomyces sp. DG2A-72]|uniref:flavin monoamine oxidase family protein n=1 Tax=Streptomyces sp. DG2A-72 TaxID=3051386 RepID=UPI00265B9205|nr:NAD(P)/FAD-dependent oxidoreductase [Streptomyces sp. DG2A-72]MDO0939333.1 NAD(P)/FAD-dependent oxidoreductase [Streptomyces sp. DG2A-72]
MTSIEQRGTGAGHPAKRRTVLKSAGAAGLLGAAGAATAGAANAAAGGHDTAPAGDGTTYDAIVVGAGYAGVTAARELEAKGLRTVVLEARERIGGRVWTRPFAGRTIDIGGTWVDEQQKLVLGELKRHGIGLLAGVEPERSIFRTPQGFTSFDPKEAFTRQGQVFDKLMTGSKEYFPDPADPFAAGEKMVAADRLSLRERMDQLRLTPEEQDWVSGITKAAGPSTRGALTQLAHWYALGGHTFGGYMAINNLRAEGGMSRLIDALLKESGADLKLNSPVVAVDDTGSQVHVTVAGGRRYKGKVAVIALPTNVWKSVAYKSGIPSEFARLSEQTIAVPRARNVLMHVRGGGKRFTALGPEGYPIGWVVPLEDLDDGWLMVGYSTDPAFDPDDRAQVGAAVRGIAPGAEVVEVLGHEWGSDPYSRGGWTHRQPGQLTGPLRAVQERHGRLAFATADIELKWTGLIEGAMHQGLRAARQLIPLASR